MTAAARVIGTGAPAGTADALSPAVNTTQANGALCPPPAPLSVAGPARYGRPTNVDTNAPRVRARESLSAANTARPASSTLSGRVMSNHIPCLFLAPPPPSTPPPGKILAKPPPLLLPRPAAPFRPARGEGAGGGAEGDVIGHDSAGEG